MAKLALINREAKRRKTVAKFAAKRTELLALANDVKHSDEERAEARAKLYFASSVWDAASSGTSPCAAKFRV
jgi:hypothetical protein